MKKKSMLRKATFLSILTLFLLLQSAAVFAGGSKPPNPIEPLPTGLTTDKEFTWGAYDRKFDVYVPAGLNGPAPLVIEMHGWNSDKESIRGYSGMRQKADQEGFIISWPMGKYYSWNGVVCCGNAQLLGIDDVGFLRELVNWIADRADVDLDRVYATGHSNGGAMSHQLGLHAADVFAAIAPVSFHLCDNATWASPARPVPMLEIHGKGDELVWYPWSPEFGTVEDGFDDWANLDECAGEPQITWQNDNGAFRKTYLDCAGNVKVEWLVLNSGHFADGLYKDNVDGVDVAQEIWDFLSQFSMP